MNRRIRLAFIIDEINIGGTEKQLLRMIELLDRINFEVFLVCLRPTTYLEEIKIPCEVKVLNVHSLRSVEGFAKTLECARYFRYKQINIAQCYFFDATVLGVLAARMAGVRYVISCRRDMGFWYTPQLLNILRIINIMTTRVQVNSVAVKDMVMKKEKISADKIDVIRNGIDLQSDVCSAAVESSSDGTMHRSNIVGIVANLNREVKRIDVFIRAAAVVAVSLPDVSFVVMGDGYLRERYENLAVSLGIGDRVLFVGRKNDPALYVNLWRLGILSSDSEGFPNAILEYMVAGVPVVATAVGGNCEVIVSGVTGFLVTAGDHEGMAAAICDLLGDEQKSDRIAKAALEYVKLNYDWNIRIDEVDNYYRLLMIAE